MKTLQEICETHDSSELDAYLEIRSTSEIFRDLAQLADGGIAQRRERVATALFAAMQANPNWIGSKQGARDAVMMADDLLIELGK